MAEVVESVHAPITPAGHILFHAVGALAAMRVYDGPRETALLLSLQEILPHVKSKNQFVQRLVEVGKLLVAAGDDRNLRCRAQWEAEQALMAMHELRLAQAQEHFKTQGAA